MTDKSAAAWQVVMNELKMRASKLKELTLETDLKKQGLSSDFNEVKINLSRLYKLLITVTDQIEDLRKRKIVEKSSTNRFNAGFYAQMDLAIKTTERILNKKAPRNYLFNDVEALVHLVLRTITPNKRWRVSAEYLKTTPHQRSKLYS